MLPLFWDLVKGFDAQTREGLRVAASISALQGEAEGVKLIDLARAAVGLSHAGLAARGGTPHADRSRSLLRVAGRRVFMLPYGIGDGRSDRSLFT